MGLRTKMAAAVVAGLPVVGWGQPAGAQGFDEFSDEVTFRRGGQLLTCSVGGDSEVHFVSGFSQIRVGSVLTDTDPACREALSHIASVGSYRLEPDGRSSSFFAVAAAPQVTANANVDGAVVSVDADHIFFFHCDDSPRGHPCQFIFHTDPK
jgi:hypothetical protein